MQVIIANWVRVERVDFPIIIIILNQVVLTGRGDFGSYYVDILVIWLISLIIVEIEWVIGNNLILRLLRVKVYLAVLVHIMGRSSIFHFQI